MRTLIFLVIVLAVGAWLGVNIANDQELFSNPFESKTVTERAKDLAGDAAEQAGDYLKEQLQK